MRPLKKIIFIILFSFHLCGCASFFTRLVTGSSGIKIPQIVAHLEPTLRENKISLLGKIVIHNPTESILELDKIYLTITDEDGNILDKDILTWERSTVMSKKELEAPVKIDLDLTTLNKEAISIFLRTTFTYKRLNLHIPIENKVAVLNLRSLKESIVRPLNVKIYTKLRTNILGAASINYIFDITNPTSIDLLLGDGKISIYTAEGKEVAESKLTQTLFKASQSNKIKGSIKLGNLFGRLIISEFIKRQSLRFQLMGKLGIPDTDISMPFNIESIQEITFSLFH